MARLDCKSLLSLSQPLLFPIKKTFIILIKPKPLNFTFSLSKTHHHHHRPCLPSDHKLQSIWSSYYIVDEDVLLCVMLLELITRLPPVYPWSSMDDSLVDWVCILVKLWFTNMYFVVFYSVPNLIVILFNLLYPVFIVGFNCKGCVRERESVKTQAIKARRVFAGISRLNISRKEACVLHMTRMWIVNTDGDNCVSRVARE